MKVLLPVVVAGLALVAFASAAVPESYKMAVLADKPYAYYRLDETNNKGEVINETGGAPGRFMNDPEAGVEGAIVSDPKGKAVHFERAKEQYIKLSKLGNYGVRISSGFAVEFWLKSADAKDHQNVLGTANLPDYVTDFLVDIGYGGKEGRLRLYCRDNKKNRFEANFYPDRQKTDLYDDHWHHLVYVYDPKQKDADQVELYIDGVKQALEVARKEGRLPKFSDFNDPLTLGAMDLRGKVEDFLDGSLDEVAFYPAPLSPEQIIKHYQAAGYNSHAPSGQK